MVAVSEPDFAPSVSALPLADSDFAPSQPDFTPRAIAADPFADDDVRFADFADEDVAVSAPEPALDATARRTLAARVAFEFVCRARVEAVHRTRDRQRDATFANPRRTGQQ